MLIDLILPKTCVGCFKELRNYSLCSNCASKIAATNAFCPHCHLRLPFGELTELCGENLGGIKYLFSAGAYENPILKAAVDALKYECIKDLRKPLAKMLARAITPPFENFGRNKREFLIVPIPLHKKRLRERGFNQSALIAREVAQLLLLPYSEKILFRVKETSQQAKLKKADRKENVKDAFTAKIYPETCGRTIILIDDVATTGSTLREAARALKQTGYKNIWAAVCAQG